MKEAAPLRNPSQVAISKSCALIKVVQQRAAMRVKIVFFIMFVFCGFVIAMFDCSARIWRAKIMLFFDMSKKKCNI